MNEHRLQLFVEEYLFNLQEPEPPRRIELMRCWMGRLQGECTESEAREIFRRLARATTRNFNRVN